jgi:hypothetical protein
VLLVCLLFIGQATASTLMSYQMMGMMGGNGQESSQNMPMMDHSNHNMDSDTSSNSSASYSENSKSSNEDCCNKTCNCFMGSCSFFALFTNVSADLSFVDLPAKIQSFSRLAQSQQVASLYRPPILG